LATEYEQRKAQPGRIAALSRSFHTFGLPAKEVDFGRFVFATHTFFAVLAKLLAYGTISRYTEVRPLGSWSSLPRNSFAEQLAELEGGSPFRAAGLGNFLEDDFFGWYVECLAPELVEGLRGIVARLAGYAALPAAGPKTRESGDLLKQIYLQLVPAAVRKVLGEYYTPDWLAERLLDLLEGGKFSGEPDVRLLDPACGSGTFLLLALGAVQNNPRARSLDPAEMLRKICQNIVGIDLKTVAAIAAR